MVREHASPKCGPGSNPGDNAFCQLWLEFFVGSLPCSAKRFPGYSAFSHLLKNQHFPIRTGMKKNLYVDMLPLNRYLLIYFTLKGHLQPACIAVMHFTEIICCNTENTNVISVFDNRILSMFLLRRVSRPAIALGCEDTIRFSKTIRTFEFPYYSKLFR